MSRLTTSAILLSACSTLASCEAYSPTDSTADMPNAASTTPSTTGWEPAAASNTWSTKAPMLAGRSFAAAATIGGTVYVVGGVSASGPFTGTLQAYNVTTNTWSSRKSLPKGRAQGNGASTINGRLYVSGGYMDNTLFMYDPASNTWTQKANMPSIGSFGSQGVINGLLYVCVGDLLWRYNPGTNKWVTLRSAPHVHQFPGAGVINGKFYVAGGDDENHIRTAFLDVYDPATNTWATKAPLPEPRTGMASATVAGKLYVAGGEGTLSSVRVYNPATNTWSSRAALIRGRRFAAGAAAGGQFFVMGGDGSSANSTSFVQAYTP
jgi:N-acetylneuraminic acid mutarotase